MPLTDISRVTTAIATLIEQALARDNFPDDVEVTAAPPEDESSQAPNTISLFLFHVMEEPHHTNLPPSQPVSSTSPVQYTHMALVLHYVITARNTNATDGNRALIEQRLMGFVARALHDFPIITDTTTVPSEPPNPPNSPILPADLAGANNRIELTLRPVTIEETVNFWSAEQQLTPRLSLFYEARVILLDTPSVTATPATVFSLGGFTSVSGQPFLEAVRNMVGFALPPGLPVADPTAPFHFLAANPARVSLFPAAPVPLGVPPDNNRFRIEGAALRDERVFLVLRGQAAEAPGPPVERSVRIDTGGAANPDWSFEVRGNEITVALRQAVEDTDGSALSLFPGLYSLRVITARQLPGDPSGRRMEQSSNELVFAISPQVTSITSLGGPPAARQFRLTLFGSYLRDELDLLLSVGGTVLRRDPATTTAGNYDFAANTGDIDFAVNTTDATSPLPVSLLISGAGSTPAWAVF